MATSLIRLSAVGGVLALAATGTSEPPVADPVTQAADAELQQFSALYGYDTGYLRNLLHDAPEAYASFSAAQGMSEHRRALPLDAHYVARVSTMLVEDCGPCTQLNLRMAVEAGVARSVLETLLHHPEELPAELRDVYDHARAVVGDGEVTVERADRIRERYGDEGFAELAVVITGCQIYPTLKRAMLAGEKCVVGELKF